MSFKTHLIVAAITQADIDNALIQMRDLGTSYSALQDCMIARVVDEDLISNTQSHLVKPHIMFGFLGDSGRACKGRLLPKAICRQLLPSDLQKELGLVHTIYMLQDPFETLDNPMMHRFNLFVSVVRNHELYSGQPWKEAAYA